MKLTAIIASFLVILFIVFNYTFAGSPLQLVTNESADTTIPEQKIVELADACHQQWQSFDWLIGQTNISAQDNPAFSQGIRNICRARAELFFEGYELSPFIAADSQSQVFPIVFRADVEEIKAQIRVHLPKLRLI